MSFKRILINVGKIVVLVLVGILGVILSLYNSTLVKGESNKEDLFANNDTELVNQLQVSNEENNNRNNIIIVNKENKLDRRYVPENLVVPNIKIQGNCSLVSEEMVDDLELMFNAALKDGINLIGVSGYRSYEYQEGLYFLAESGNSSYDSDYVAIPGYSEHQTGLAIDILSDEYSVLDDGFKDTEAYKWLIDNCYKYGFIIRYPEGKESITGYPFEPWHLRYVGIAAATEIAKKGVTLEEYVL